MRTCVIIKPFCVLIDTVSEWIQMNQVREENDSLKCQLEAYKNEVGGVECLMLCVVLAREGEGLVLITVTGN